MTDHELLEAAAKAAGIDLWTEWDANEKPTGRYCNGPSGDVWSPLNDDGDALRLAVRLRLRINCYDDQVETMDGCDPFRIGRETFTNTFVRIEPTGADREAATRRAIVRAAAEIGKTAS